jgi:hypothetical protein
VLSLEGYCQEAKGLLYYNDNETYLSLNEQNCWLMTCQTISSEDMAEGEMVNSASEAAFATGGGVSRVRFHDLTGQRFRILQALCIVSVQWSRVVFRLQIESLRQSFPADPSVNRY